MAQEVSAKIQSGEVSLDIVKISELVSQSLAGSGGRIVNLSSLVLVTLWVVAVIDSFRIGWSQRKVGDSFSKKT